MTHGRLASIALIVLGLILGLAGMLYLVAGWTEGSLRYSGFLLGALVLLVLCLPLVGAGAFLWFHSAREARALSEAAKQSKLLSIVRARGRVHVDDLAIEMGLTRSQVRDYVYSLVGKELFSGYINWEEGILYGRDATEMRTTKCPNCGGIREVVGKGVIKCPYCGFDLFL